MVPETAPLQLETFLPYRLAVLSSLTAQALSVVHVAHGLTQAEWVILTAVAEQPRTTAKVIGATFHMQKAKVSRGVSALLQRKFISTTLHRKDRRLVELQLTPDGEALYQECAKAVADFAKDLESALGREDREALVRGLDRLVKAALTLNVRNLVPAGNPS
jgi:DNA-binding MarR family transcriptional regulator